MNKFQQRLSPRLSFPVARRQPTATFGKAAVPTGSGRNKGDGYPKEVRVPATIRLRTEGSTTERGSSPIVSQLVGIATEGPWACGRIAKPRPRRRVPAQRSSSGCLSLLTC